ncbi:exocyst complex component 8-like, partial [Saccoglossus kowalevskii]|uniref:Exocyst complex component 8-like n=1 Tax=Saccoglossus kowalevskii TaxID=10224 RepID=A0ABM0MDB3_SACKO
MCTIGLDLSFALDGFLLKNIRDTLKHNKDLLMEATKHRTMDEKWRPLNLQNSQSASQLSQEMLQLGIANFNSHIYDKCWVNLSSSTVMFTKAFINFLDNEMKLYIPELYTDIVDSMMEVLQHYVDILASFAVSDRHTREREFILQNIEFIFNTMIPLTETKTKDIIGHQVKSLTNLYKEHQKIKQQVESLGVLI